MTTGYTELVEKGCTFKEFALTCARQFQPLAHMRDSSLKAKIPDIIIPYDYFHDISKNFNEFKKYYEMSEDDAEEEAQEEHEKICRDIDSIKNHKLELKNKYMDMLEKVRKWNPAEEYKPLKDFMINQLEESIKFDCNLNNLEYPKLKSGAEYKEEKIDSILTSMEFYSKKYRESIEYVKRKTEWIQNLKQSLNEFEEGIERKC